MRAHSRLPASAACAALLLAGRAGAWTTLESTDGAFPESNVTYFRMAMDLAQLEPGMSVRLRISCPKARYFSLNVYGRDSGASWGLATDRAITREGDRAKPPCAPGQSYDVWLVGRASEPKEERRELALPQVSARAGVMEVWFRVYLPEEAVPPSISLISADGENRGAPVEAGVQRIPTSMTLPEAAANQPRLPPGPRGDRLVMTPTQASGFFPNGHAYLAARLDDDVRLSNPRRFTTPLLPFRGSEQFVVLRFKAPTTPGRSAAGTAPEVRYWSLCTVDAPSTTLLRDGGGGACLSDKDARIGPDGTVTVILGSPGAARYARSMGVNALPVYYPRPVVAMPMVIFRMIPNDPDFKWNIPLEASTEAEAAQAMGDYMPQGRYFPLGWLRAVVEAARNSS